jgi:hypothetical protein
MSKLTITDPVIGEKVTASDPKIIAALTAISEWANGNIGANNIEAKGVTEAMLSTAVQTLLNEKTAGGVMKKSIIATEETRESAVFGTLTTPDEVEVVMPTNGLIAVWYQATWQESVAKAARASIFIGANQLKVAGAVSGTEPTGQAAAKLGTSTASFMALFSGALGLASSAFAVGWTGDVTTGQAVGFATFKANAEQISYELGGIIEQAQDGTGFGGPCYIFAAAGTYKISVKFKASSGKVTAKNRKLWALAYS